MPKRPPKIASFVEPSKNDLAAFKRLSADEQRALMRVEMDEDFAAKLNARRAEAVKKTPDKTK